MARTSIWILMMTALSGCFENIAPDQPDAGPQPDAPPPGKVTTTRETDGSYLTIVDSTSGTDWCYADFETGAETPASGPWDLRFQRFHISTNGGASGTRGVQVVPMSGVAFSELTTAPASGWISDAPDGEDPNMDPDYAFDQGAGWYDYNPMNNVLTAKPLIWAVKLDSDSMIKLQIVRYYNDAGTSGWFTLRWAPL